MKRFPQTGWNRTSALLLLTLIALVFAAGLDRVAFHSGYRLDIPEFSLSASGGGGLEGGHRAFMLVLWSIIAASVFSIVVSLFTLDGRKRLLLSAVFILGAFVVLGVITELLPDLEARPVPEAMDEGASEAGGWADSLPGLPADATGERPEPQDAPAGLGYALAALLSLLAGVVVYRMTLRGAREDETNLDSLDQSGELRAWASDTRSQLGAPDGVVDVVQQAYFDLERLAREHLGSQRDQTTSAREFVRILTDYGLPRNELMTLVGLFEQSRYGEKNLPSRDRERARQALHAIVDTIEYSEGPT